MKSKINWKLFINFLTLQQNLPELEATPLLKCGKWYVSTGKEWICHSDLELSAFEWEFLQSLDVEIRETIHFEVNYLPFQ
ncbi:DUF3884 family protein [Enterococcus faecium]